LVLHEHTVMRWGGDLSTATGVPIPTEATPMLAAATRALLDDESQQVRDRALNEFRKRRQSDAPPALTAEELIAYVPGMRHADARGKVLEVLCLYGTGDVDPRFVDLALADPSPEAFQVVTQIVSSGRLPLVDARYWLCFERVIGGLDPQRRLQWLERAGNLTHTAPGAAAFFDWLESRKDNGILGDALEYFAGDVGQGVWRGWASGLDDERLARAFVALVPSSASELIWQPVSTIQRWRSKDAAPWIKLVNQPDAPSLARVAAARLALSADALDRATLDTLMNALIRAIAEASRGDIEKELVSAVEGFPRQIERLGGDGIDWATRLLEAPDVTTSFLEQILFQRSDVSPVGAARFIDAAVARLPLATWASSADSDLRWSVVNMTRFLGAERRAAVLEAALLVDDAKRASVLAYDVLGADPEPPLLGALQRLVASGKPYERTRAAKAAAAFLSDDAAKLILDIAAATPGAEERASVLAALDQVTQYQAAKARWEQRSDAAAVRVRALGELTALLDDPKTPEAQQVEALRGLGLLGAVEELPRLVRTLGSPSPALQAAAREALARLNREGQD